MFVNFQAITIVIVNMAKRWRAASLLCLSKSSCVTIARPLQPGWLNFCRGLGLRGGGSILLYIHHKFCLLVFQIKCPLDYRLWLETMYILFGSKWSKIFCGPMWSHAPIMQAEVTVQGSTAPINTMNPTKANLHIMHECTVVLFYYCLGTS